jgi:2-polyprenyl-3-methyl-5-hydroxy-6-metoxy-1,4-benzoquinol methylase
VIERAALARILRFPLPTGSSVLDVPCGAGALTLALRSRGLNAHGVDVDPSAAAVLHDHFTAADLSVGIPCGDRSFDVVVSVEGIEHLENPFAFLREMHRVLRPSGRLVLTTPNIASLRSRVRFFGSGFYHQDPRPLDESARHPLHHIALRTLSDLRYAMHTTGLRVVEVGSTHVKPISYAYALFAPWTAVYTAMAFRKEKNAAQRERNRDIRRALLSPAVLFGENLMLVAERLS